LFGQKLEKGKNKFYFLGVMIKPWGPHCLWTTEKL